MPFNQEMSLLEIESKLHSKEFLQSIVNNREGGEDIKAN